ncbi:UV-B-induced protein At3g17800, chloroplastic-like isoform X1 [Salvia hispanica]|uniref:UV-B-induced protein At3g17800, chloroplastic-like isoform X1 n=1 Tax=Salvia hispanica TaxID=49212 RepID=UPI0020090943|nr:UV-B-induced protein At3g17800, chloroplastic-like isoform X1 [Salvia hispanica]
MDCCFFSYTNPRFPTPPARRPISLGPRLIVVAGASSSRSRCDFGGLHAPLEPRTPAGRLLSGVCLDDRAGFHAAARGELERLAVERDEAAARLQLSLGSDEACLHRRIAEFRQHECQDAVEDVMYMLIFYKFSEIGVSLVPRLSKCAYNGRLEIWPSKDWELESIHNSEVLQMVREHLSALVGCKANSNVTDSWATTKVQRFRLCEMYAASILYGYFLKTASLRYQLERGLDLSSSHYGLAGRGKHPVSEMFTAGSSYIAHGRVSSSISTPASPVSYSLGNNPKSLRLYMMGFDHESVQMCAKPKSKEAVDLLERHTAALFGDEETGLLETDDALTTSFASLKRFLLEAVAFGSFLWSAENFVSDVYMLEDN